MNESELKLSPSERLEVLFLKVFKMVVLAAMGLSILVAMIFAVVSAFNFMQTPKESRTVAEVPKKEISFDKLLDSFNPKIETKVANVNPTNEQNAPQAGASLKYQEEATKLYRCSLEFAKKVGANIEDSGSAAAINQIELYRSQFEQLANEGEYRGNAYIIDATKFVCLALENPKLIALYKEKNLSGVFLKTLNFHLKEWDRLGVEISDFVGREERRKSAELMQEQLRVSKAKADAIIYIIVAGSAFVMFMALALYLLLSKMENNLRHLSLIRTFKQS